MYPAPAMTAVAHTSASFGSLIGDCRAAGGTVLACRLALDRGLAINLGGGYHHAGPARGGGFCAYADVPLALALLHSEGRLRSALVVDTNGT